MGLKETFEEVLLHPENIVITPKQFSLYENNTRNFLSYYNNLPLDKRLEFAVSATSYFFGKALEIGILGKIRPSEKAIWLIPEEVFEGITFDLPKHLENDVIDLMDPFESAVEDYISNNMNVELVKIWILAQAYGFNYAVEHKLYEHTVGGILNEKVLSNNELYRFGMNAFAQEITKHGFAVEQVSPNLADFANAILKKENATYLVSTSVTILPREGYIADWRLDRLKKESSRLGFIPAYTTIGLIPSDELLASEGIVVKEGEYKVQIKKLINALTGDIIE